MPRSPALKGEKLEKAVKMKKNGASYPKIAEEFDISQSVAYRNVKPELEEEAEKEKAEAERKETESKTKNSKTIHETETLSKTVFRKALELFINGKNSEQIADHLDIPQASIEYELLPYVNELKTTRKLQKKVEGIT
ncbi:hypothetical protein AKJ56_02025 [candidate division MSBL1 archaeon SCGC-AAA382N08]|uniref:Resolvase HTH domain-containing protein n=1 Tax=candidate division MSBL1 archaeon SCGC-AAA382N08 TaxID=1698285 RepID=A0A133VNH0_9EURY|nr:hypothetical protein AKJ56_02025 [candidate division MSBL1 archaeon SCGC-AAA382N08]